MMTRKTTTRNLTNAITSQKVSVSNVTLNYSDDDCEKRQMEPDKLIESLEFLNESDIFAEAVDWRYDRIRNQGREDAILIRGGRMASYRPCTVDFELHMTDGVNVGDVERILVDGKIETMII